MQAIAAVSPLYAAERWAQIEAQIRIIDGRDPGVPSDSKGRLFRSGADAFSPVSPAPSLGHVILKCDTT